MIAQLWEDNYSHFEFIDAMNGGDCECELHQQLKEEEGK